MIDYITVYLQPRAAPRIRRVGVNALEDHHGGGGVNTVKTQQLKKGGSAGPPHQLLWCRLSIQHFVSKSSPPNYRILFDIFEIVDLSFLQVLCLTGLVAITTMVQKFIVMQRTLLAYK